MALAESQHHSAQRPKTARAGGEVRVELHGHNPEQPPLQPELFSLFEEEPGSSRPPCPGEPRGPQDSVLRHTVEQMPDVCPFVQILDALVLQTGMGICRWRSSGFRTLRSPSRPSSCPRSQDRIQYRLAEGDLRHPQMAEPLVKVPTILSPSLLQQQGAELIVHNQVPRGRRGLGRWRSSRFSPRTEFNCVACSAYR